MTAKITLADLVSESSLEALAGERYFERGIAYYDQAVDLVRRIRNLMARTGKGTDFSPYLDTLRTQHKAKHNFMQRLDAAAAEPAKKGTSRKRVQ
jgi:uncharacterized Zn finger protein